MNMKNKAIAIVLCVYMLASIFTAPAFAAEANITFTVNQTEVEVGDTIIVEITNDMMTVSGFGGYLTFDKELLECTSAKGVVSGTEDEGYGALNQVISPIPTAFSVFDSVENTNKDGIFSFGLVTQSDVNYAAGIIAKLTFAAKAAGTAVFTLTEESSGADAYKAETKSTDVSIVVAVTGVTLNKTAVELTTAGATATLAKTVAPEDATNKDVIWTSSNPAVAIVDAEGNVTAVANGTATITVTTVDGGKTATCEVTVNISGGGGGGTTVVSPPEKPKLPSLNKDPKLIFMGGYTDKLFRPDAKMTRGEVAAVFARLMDVERENGKVYISEFCDVPMNLWCANDISFIEQYGLLAGYEDGTFRPNEPITRAELVAIASRFEKLTVGPKVFSDVGENHWAEDSIHSAAAAKWINGYEDGTFCPDSHVTRAEVAAILCNVLDYNINESSVVVNYNLITSFADVRKDHWAYWSIIAAANAHK